jgi:hypothetical protein
MSEDSALPPSENTKPIIALDCDGVLLDYDTTFAQIYKKTFGKQLTIVSPKASCVSSIIFLDKFILLIHI